MVEAENKGRRQAEFSFVCELRLGRNYCLGVARARLARTRLHLALSHVRAPRLRRPPRLVDPARWPFNCGAYKLSILTKAHSLQGVLAGFDQKSNIVLSNCTERVYSLEDGVEEVPLGLYLVKGETMCAPISFLDRRD